MSISSAYNQPLHKALLGSDMNSLQNLADQHSIDIQLMMKAVYILSTYSKQGCYISPLQAAVIVGNYQMCKRLIHEGAKLYSPSYHMSHPLIIALDIGKFQIARLLIQSGADVISPQHGFCPMYYAIKSQSPEFIVEEIINAGFPPDNILEGMSRLTALHRAVALNNIPIVKLLMKYKVNCDTKDSQQGYTPIHRAVKNNLPHLVRLLAIYGANLDIECEEGYTPLFSAIINNDLESTKILIQYGAKINHLSTVKLIYPLNLSASLCQEEITKFLLIQGASAKSISPATGNSALHSAAMSQQGKISETNGKQLERVVQMLIDNGAEIESPNKYGHTAIQLAIKEENFKVVELLVYNGASVNSALDYGTNFHFVAKMGSKAMVNLFLKHGADPFVFDKNGVTPYHTAILNTDKTVLSVFWKFYCPFDLPMYESSRKPLYGCEILSKLENQKMLMLAIKTNDVNLIYNVLKKGADIKCCSLDIPLPLHFAAENGFHSIVHLMLDNGVPTSFTDKNGETPLHVAARLGDYRVCFYLLHYGASYNCVAKSSGKTPLELAIENNHYDIVSVLKGINTLFKHCNEKNNVSKVKILLKKYQDDGFISLALVNCVNRYGDTLMAKALRKGSIKLANYLMKFRVSNTQVH